MSSLYNISSEFEQLLFNISESGGEVQEIQEQRLHDLMFLLESKTDNCVEYLRMVEDEIETVSNRVKELETILKQKKTKLESYENYLRMCLTSFGKDKLKGKIHQISLRKPTKKVEIVADHLIPFEFLEVKEVVSFKRKEIGDALKSGVEVSGAVLVDGKASLSWK